MRNTSMYLQLADADLSMYQATGDEFYKQRAMEILQQLTAKEVQEATANEAGERQGIEGK